MPVAATHTTYPADRVEIPCFYCTPDGDGPFPPVLVIHGSDGFKDNHADIALRLARSGFAAIGPTWFGGESARTHWDEVEAADLTAAADWLEKQPEILADRMGLMGFSRGGGLALVIGSMLPRARAIVNYFGLTRWQGGLQELARLKLNAFDPYNFVGRLSCPVLSFHGENDTVVPVEDTLNLDNACRQYGVPHDYTIYPEVDHSFIWAGGDTYRPEAHADSWEKAIAFLKKNLGISR